MFKKTTLLETKIKSNPINCPYFGALSYNHCVNYFSLFTNFNPLTLKNLETARQKKVLKTKNRGLLPKKLDCPQNANMVVSVDDIFQTMVKAVKT